MISFLRSIDSQNLLQLQIFISQFFQFFMQDHNFPLEFLNHHLCVLLVLALQTTCVFYVFPFGLRRGLILAFASTLSFLLLFLLFLFFWLSDFELFAEEFHIVIEQLKDFHPVFAFLLLLFFQFLQERFGIMSQLQILLALSLVQALPSVALAGFPQLLHEIDNFLSVSRSCFRSQLFSLFLFLALNCSDIIADAEYGLGVFINVVEYSSLHLEQVIAFPLLLQVLLLVVRHMNSNYYYIDSQNLELFRKRGGVFVENDDLSLKFD